MNQIRIGITIGDINGIGPEVIIKALSNNHLLNQCTPIIYGSAKAIAYHKNIVKSNINFNTIGQAQDIKPNAVNVLNCWDEAVNIELGKANEDGGKYAHIAIDRAFRDYNSDQIDAIVTAPINKYAMSLAGFPHPGHTEYFSSQYSDSTSIMMMISEDLRIALVTNHLPLSEVASHVTQDTVLTKIRVLHKSLVEDFNIDKPKIAVLGLNPHAGDNGKIGTNEDAHIHPAIVKAKEEGIMAMGAFPADGFFGSGDFKKFDAVLAMYHDQGLIPFKSLTFGTGTNYTAGLPLIRTSPDHGTAYDIAGQNKADESSLLHAIYRAIDISRQREQYHEDRKDALQKRPKKNYERR